ncbi:hypothetical protein BV20DRAFT_805040 [Pilatotrama ljubarskyi]|nr:hypothetical protein BV20DRAFT_805040 [Pilatotrama ljubarskyi]
MLLLRRGVFRQRRPYARVVSSCVLRCGYRHRTGVYKTNLHRSGCRMLWAADAGACYIARYAATVGVASEAMLASLRRICLCQPLPCGRCCDQCIRSSCNILRFDLYP